LTKEVERLRGTIVQNADGLSLADAIAETDAKPPWRNAPTTCSSISTRAAAVAIRRVAA
jgi:hypothetical protein